MPDGAARTFHRLTIVEHWRNDIAQRANGVRRWQLTPPPDSLKLQRGRRGDVPDKEKVFISWSGNRARDVALRMRELIELVSDNIDPFVSEADIELGTRSMDTVAEKLSECRIAIIIVTPENYDKPWLNFEAGAISSQIDDPKTRVIPMLVGMSVPLPAGPLTQFQAQELSSKGLDKLFAQLAISVSATPAVFQKRLDLDKAAFLDEVGKLVPDDTTKKAPQVDLDDMVREILQSTRDLSSLQLDALERIQFMFAKAMERPATRVPSSVNLPTSERMARADELVGRSINSFIIQNTQRRADLQLRLDFDERKVRVVTGHHLARKMQADIIRIVDETDPYHREVSFIVREIDPVSRRQQAAMDRSLATAEEGLIDPDSL